MSNTEQSTKPTPPAADERVKEMSGFRKAMIRPELGGIIGTILVFVFFFLTARDSGMFSPAGVMNWSIVSAQFIAQGLLQVIASCIRIQNRLTVRAHVILSKAKNLLS